MGEAIFKALSEHFTVKSIPQNQGYGLFHINELIGFAKGTLQIISNDGYFKKHGNQIKIAPTKQFFQGTFIKVEIDLNTFDESDEEEQILDF